MSLQMQWINSGQASVEAPTTTNEIGPVVVAELHDTNSNETGLAIISAAAIANRKLSDSGYTFKISALNAAPLFDDLTLDDTDFDHNEIDNGQLYIGSIDGHPLIINEQAMKIIGAGIQNITADPETTDENLHVQYADDYSLALA